MILLMWSNPAICVENLGKYYRLAKTKSVDVSAGSEAGVLWAVRGVSFEVAQGEAVGIIGGNGAGKSTLLKMLSRVTRPSEGRARWRGRIASLLEVGSGFHPELTGRENIFLSGAVLGMSHARVRRRLDEIVSFAEVERFLDEPVKHYSSGMYTRLAFAVAAHLEPEIWILDEILAVGDAAFSRKCLDKMTRATQGGVTVLFVSHNLNAIAKLCSRTLWLDGGTLRQEGESRDVIRQYLGADKKLPAERVWLDPKQAPGSDSVRLRSVRVSGSHESEHPTASVSVEEEIEIQVEYWNQQPAARLSAGIHLHDMTGTDVLASANLPSLNLTHDEWFGQAQPAGLYRVVCRLPSHLLNEQRYSISVFIARNLTHAEVSAYDILTFDVFDANPHKEYSGALPGAVRPKLLWQTQWLQPLDSRDSST